MSGLRCFSLKRLSLVAGVVVVLLFVFNVAMADTLTIMDGTDAWTLDVETGCTTCSMTLQVVYGSASARAGLYLDSIQWDLTSPNVGPSGDNPSALIGFTGTTAGSTSDWAFKLGNLNANQCGGGDKNATCGEFVGVSTPAAAGGYGAITNGLTLSWEFETTFSSALPVILTTGNIRAAYNDSTGKNAGIFSPDGGSFVPPCDEPGSPSCGDVPVPEPTSLFLLGAGLLALCGIARRNRR